MDNKECELLAGVVEADETYVGGNPRKGRDKNAKRGRGTKNAPVVGVVERGGRVIAIFMPKIKGENLFNFIIGGIKPDESILMTDEYVGYDALDGAVPRGIVNHLENYVDDDGVTHTNTIEGFWVGIRRVFYGVHHWYSKKWINYYIAEACYKYNERANEECLIC